MAILGLQNVGNLANYMALTNRRKVFYTYPNGAAPLVGILSVMEDEVTDSPVFGWWEHRFVERATTLAAGSQFYTASSFTDLGSSTASTSPITFTKNTAIQVRFVTGGVTQASLRVGDVLTLFNMAMTAGTADLKVLVTAVDYSTPDKVTVRILETPSSTVLNAAGNNGKAARVTGSAHEEGSGSKTRVSRYPLNPGNYTQIFKTPFSFTRTALKVPLEWDKTGIYKHDAKDRSLDHMVDIENSFLFSPKSSYAKLNEDGDTMPERTTGGIEYFLRQWDLGNTASGGEFDYRPGGTAATTNADPNKRIIDHSTTSNTCTRAELEGYLQRVFAVSNNRANEKLCLCGAGFLTAINVAYERQITINKNMGKADNETYGMNLTGLQTVHGMVWFKTHPLFSQRSEMTNSAMILDTGKLKYRYLADSDTTLLKNRQNPDQDRRKDEWLTECGLEVRFPESHIYLKNIAIISA